MPVPRKVSAPRRRVAPNAEARLLGDVSAAKGELEEAVKEYPCCQSDLYGPEVTPKALTKAINIYRTLGNQEKAQELTQEPQHRLSELRRPGEALNEALATGPGAPLHRQF